MGFNAIIEVNFCCINQCMDISSVILGIKVIKRGKPNTLSYTYMFDYNTYLTSLNDIFMLYKVKITYTKHF